MKKLKIETEIFEKDTGAFQKAELPQIIHDPKTGDPVEVDEIEIEQIRWSRKKGRCFVTFSVGGRNSKGEYIDDRNRKMPELPYLFLRDKHTHELWKKYKLDDGPPTVETVKQMLLEEKPAINTVARCHWIAREDLPTKRFKASVIEG